VLDALLPFALIYGAVGPKHFSITISLIVHIAAFEDVSAFPRKDTVAALSIVDIFSLILIAG
jgi:hypothetical protein